MRRPGLRFQLACALMAASALAVAVSSVLTGRGLQRTFDDYLSTRVQTARQSAVAIARTEYREAGNRWSRPALDAIVHDFTLTGYDLRLVARGSVLLDTGRPTSTHGALVALATAPVPGGDGRPVATIEVLGRSGNGSFPGDAQFRQAFDHAHLVAALTAGGIAFLFGAFAAGWLTRPLRRLVSVARNMSQGTRHVAVGVGGPKEVRALAGALTELSRDLDRQDRSRRHLAENLAHELRTPLMLIQGRIEAMQDGVTRVGPTGMAALHTEVLRLSRLIEQIERLASDEAHPPVLRRVPVRLDDIADELRANLSGAFETRNIILEVDAVPARGIGDPDAVRQIVTNLLTNATKYAPANSRVSLTVESSVGWAVLAVSDTGPPIPERERERIFQRFTRGSGIDGTRGAGLGLAIARDLAMALGGTLDLARSETGNRFEFRLPSVAPPLELSPRRSLLNRPGGPRRSANTNS